jgi:hypothetical protein
VGVKTTKAEKITANSQTTVEKMEEMLSGINSLRY